MQDEARVQRPRIGNVTGGWSIRGGQRVLVLQNAAGLTQSAIALPESLAMLPALCDGTRDVGALRASLMIRAGIQIPESTLAGILEQMDSALLFENGQQAQVLAQARQEYRDLPCRRPALAGHGYPVDRETAEGYLSHLIGAAEAEAADISLPASIEDLRGVLSPHIDFTRGGQVYASAWRLAQPALQEVEIVVLLGTDHRGPDAAITPTSQHYATPWGPLTTAAEEARRLADALGSIPGADEPFRYELHHAAEHSIELAAFWLHAMAPEPGFTLLPILCGSFDEIISGLAGRDSPQWATVEAAVSFLRELASRRRTLLVAAADLAHIGPAFGGQPAQLAEKAACRSADEALLEAMAGGGEPFLELIRREGANRNICGVPPIYLMLRAMEPIGDTLVSSYDLCPADQQGTSWVTIAGALLW